MRNAEFIKKMKRDSRIEMSSDSFSTPYRIMLHKFVFFDYEDEDDDEDDLINPQSAIQNPKSNNPEP